MLSKQTRQDLQNALHDHQEAKSELRTAKLNYKIAEKNDQKLLKTSTDAEKRYLGKKHEARKEAYSKEVKSLKDNIKTTQEKKKGAIQRNGGTGVQKIAKAGHYQVSSAIDSAFQEDEGLEGISNARQKFRRVNAEVQQAKKIGRYSFKIGSNTGKSTYHVGNKAYNLLKGRGFTRTAVPDRWETKFKNKYQKSRAKINSSKVGKSAKAVKNVTSKMSKPILAILKNPLSAKAYLIILIGFIIIALLGVVSGGGGSTVSQDEFDLTDSWTYLSKIDREKSTSEVDYWTDIDSIMTFMGYKHEDYTLNSNYDSKDKKWYQFKHSYKELLTTLWGDLNGDKDNLKTMADIYTSTNNKYLKLNKDDQREYEEVLEQGKELGYYISYNELESPLTNKPDDDTIEPLTVTKRFGYTSKTKLYNGSILKADKGSPLYAVMEGKIVIKNSDVIIKAKTAEFTYKNVNRLRVKNGDTVKSGLEIGAVGSGKGQEIYYQKLKDKKQNKWAWVNVGFYLPKVEYSQTTSVMTDMSIEGDMAKKITSIYNFLKKQDPKVTQNGVASALGSFWTESSINPKRAEGDYLSPPVGASASSWDDEAWLTMGGPSIYNGRYGNILHRGLGLGQWTDTADGATRHTMLLKFAKSKNKKWYDLELQLDFMLNGDSPYYITTLKEILHSNENVSTLAVKFASRWEGNQGDKTKERVNNAQQVLNYLKHPTSGGAKGGSKTLQSSFDFPESYRNKLKTFPSSATVSSSLAGNTYPPGQCTWYVYNRLVEAGSPHYNYLGNGQDWVRGLVLKGWKFSNKPVAGAVCSTTGGFDGTFPMYGHVSYVEYVNPDGTFLISECNYNGVQNRIHWGVKTNATCYTFAIPPK